MERFEHNQFKHGQNEMAYVKMGKDEGPIVMWAHGWGQSHAAFLQLAQSFENQAQHYLIDFPGFGDSKIPTEKWGTQDYADFTAEFIKSITRKKVIWVGHSFGCRVGLQLAARHPDLVQGLFLVAGAGLPRKHPFHRKLFFKIRSLPYKMMKQFIPLGLDEEWLKSKFGSADYKNAGAMRDILVKVVNEDLSEVAQTIACPTQLVYGTKDTETPPEIGERFHALIKNSKMVHLEGQDHYSILGEGRHKLASLFKNFLEEVTP